MRAISRTLAILGVACVQAWAVNAADSASAAPAGAAPATIEEKTADLKGKVDGLEESYLTTKADVEKIRKFKLSGYIQAQVRYALDTAGNANFKIGDYAGGAFSDWTRAVFSIRRGRLKLTYDNDITQGVIELDATPSGIALKDCYLQFKDPWLKAFALRGGTFDRPFGFEVPYSSSALESPERSRVVQVLFPGEKDLGAQLEIAAPDKAPAWARILNLKIGEFAGNGIAVETDRSVDLIGRLGLSIPITAANMSIDGGFSWYAGKVTNTDTTWGGKSVAKIDSSWITKTTYVYDSTQGKEVPVLSAARKYDTTWTIKTRGYSYTMDNDTTKFVKSTPGELNKDFSRKYFGGDLELYYDIPYIGGFQVRGEVFGGQQPGTKGSSGFYSPGRNSNQPVYLRDFRGGYVTWVQNWGHRVQSVLKYDIYDPNTKVKSADFDSLNVKSGNLSATDLEYKTLGLGLVFYWDANVRFQLYWDHVTNEKMSSDVLKLKDMNQIYTHDLKDDVLTFRIQYKF